MEMHPRKSTVPFYAVAVLWIVSGALLPLYAPMHYGLLAAVSAAVFLAVNALCRGGGVARTAEAAVEQAEVKKEESTGDPALDKMLKDGRLAIAEMKRLDDNIADPGISADIVRLEQVSAKIFDEVKQDPKKLPQIRRFMDYYLPTTLKLLNSYDRMSTAGVSGQNIDTTLARVEGMMRTVVAAFEKQLDSLYGAEALDISTDITVLESMIVNANMYLSHFS
ncbi:5-bromo-4-chloroindolyl phosphate hydrolysis family protein [Oscillibacter sp.]|uniref:5-bromo-4-chloroindolyl phosphate hydrolysis family protein n=1 Tax=Oscillibacter sp. TaxID=1945593 RepID=UPI002602FF47|nr:5-bromo-4-chloroindolyl phosphate hydrolysis family protein [Oscillibacter sp.]MDD3347057.1 5-bromo-4-chloroindolyl phosphate hydrolysis family protein [Oscillibacter sp.]